VSDSFEINSVESTEAPRIPTRAELEAAREQEERGFLFHLHRSGYDAHVRYMSIADLSTVVGLPVAQQQVVLKVFNDYREQQNRDQKQNKLPPLTWDKVLANQASSQELADTLVCAGFIKPRVVMNESDLDPNDPHMITVHHLNKSERLRYSQIVLGQNDEEAAKLAPFPETGMGRVATVSVLPKHEDRTVNEDALSATGI
jgi:hypothetical protein